MTAELDFAGEALRSLRGQVAETVTDNLRGVIADLRYPWINVDFYFAEEPSDRERELVDDCEGFVAADMWSPVMVNFTTSVVPISQVQTHGVWIFGGPTPKI